jgi:hypothetical protein
MGDGRIQEKDYDKHLVYPLTPHCYALLSKHLSDSTIRRY